MTSKLPNLVVRAAPKLSEWNDVETVLESGSTVVVTPTDKEYVWCWGRYDDSDLMAFEGYYDATRDQWYAHNNGDYVDGGFGQDYKAEVIKWHYLPSDPT